eukprot:1190023-Prorocentrum_minimum.AAC.2
MEKFSFESDPYAGAATADTLNGVLEVDYRERLPDSSFLRHLDDSEQHETPSEGSRSDGVHTLFSEHVMVSRKRKCASIPITRSTKKTTSGFNCA